MSEYVPHASEYTIRKRSWARTEQSHRMRERFISRVKAAVRRAPPERIEELRRRAAKGLPLFPERSR